MEKRGRYATAGSMHSKGGQHRLKMTAYGSNGYKEQCSMLNSEQVENAEPNNQKPGQPVTAGMQAITRHGYRIYPICCQRVHPELEQPANDLYAASSDCTHEYCPSVLRPRNNQSGPGQSVTAQTAAVDENRQPPRHA